MQTVKKIKIYAGTKFTRKQRWELLAYTEERQPILKHALISGDNYDRYRYEGVVLHPRLVSRMKAKLNCLRDLSQFTKWKTALIFSLVSLF